MRRSPFAHAVEDLAKFQLRVGSTEDERDVIPPEKQTKGRDQQVCFDCCGCGFSCYSDGLCTCAACGGRGRCPRLDG